MQVLFFGDSMRSDISPAKKYANWDTVLVLEEMEAELDDYCDISDGNDDETGSVPKRQRSIVSNYSTVWCMQWVTKITNNRVIFLLLLLESILPVKYLVQNLVFWFWKV